MTPALDRTVQKLGDGKVILLDSGESAFKLDSFENNPIVKPQDLALTWHENGEPKIGAHGKPVLFLHPKDFCGTLVELEQA